MFPPLSWQGHGRAFSRWVSPDRDGIWMLTKGSYNSRRAGSKGAIRSPAGRLLDGHPLVHHLEILVELRQDQAPARGDQLVGRQPAGDDHEIAVLLGHGDRPAFE